jgi:hypothetical protein
MSTFAPLQFLKSAQNPLVWTAVDNGTDTRTSLIIYYGAANTLPSDTGMYEVNCIMMHQAEKQLYANTGTTTTPTWEAFGPNSAFPQPLVPGSFLFTDGATVYWATQLVGQVQYNASNLNTYGILNFNNLLVASNDVPNSRINVDLDVVALGADATFISTLEGNLDLANIGGAIDLSTQVTGLLDVSNIDVTSLANDATFVDALVANTYFTSELANNATFIGDLITELNLVGDIAVVADGVTITGTGTTLDPLVAVGGGGTGTALETTVSQTAHGLSVGDVIKVSGTNTFAKAQGNTEVNSEAVGVVTTVVNANSFKYVSSAIQLAYAPAGTPGSAVWLSPTVAGGMTTTKPSSTGHVARALGTIIESGAKMYFDIAALAEVIGSGSGSGGGGTITNPTYVDDFLTSAVVSGTAGNWTFSSASGHGLSQKIGDLGWGIVGPSGQAWSVSSEANHPGMIFLQGSSYLALIGYDNGAAGIANPIPTMASVGNEYQFIIKTTTLTASQWIDVRIANSTTGNFKVRFNGNSGNIVFTTDDGTTTNTNIGTTANNTWYNVKFVVTGSGIECYLNGTLVATHTTNIPTGGGFPMIFDSSSGGTYIDYFAMKIANLTR